MERPKWHKSDKPIQVGDVVLFLKSEGKLSEVYQYGIVLSVYESKDGNIRKVDIEYKNYSENIKRVTVRGVRDLVIVHPVDELDIYEQLHECSE